MPFPPCPRSRRAQMTIVLGFSHRPLPPRCAYGCAGGPAEARQLTSAEVRAAFRDRLTAVPGKHYYACAYCGCIWLQPDKAPLGHRARIVRFPGEGGTPEHRWNQGRTQ
jgi:hypothetical protein